MSKQITSPKGLPWLITLYLLGWQTTRGDWPTYRGDTARTGFVTESIPSPLRLQWHHQPATAPKPAWPAPARRSYWQRLDTIDPRSADDATFQPVIGSNRVFFGSSSDDHLYCLDANTGQIIWSFCSDGPIRYAPCLSDERIFFGSDDGNVYCLDALNGSFLWKHRVAGEDHRISGNGRMISAWPVRTGCLVIQGIVYATAGLFPQQGTYACAMDARMGDVIWKQRTEDSPQGYLLGSAHHLYVPTGRGNPVALDLKTGALKKRFSGVGGSFSVLSEKAFVSGRGNDGSLTISETQSAESIVQVRGSQLVMTPHLSIYYDEPHVTVLDRKRHFEHNLRLKQLNAERGQLQSLIKSKKQNEGVVHEARKSLLTISARLMEAQKGLQECVRLKFEVGACKSMLVSQERIVVGRNGGIDLYNITNGTKESSLPLDGVALGMAFNKGKLIVSTDQGSILCYAASALDDSPTDTSPLAPIADVPPSRGFTVFIGAPAEKEIGMYQRRSGFKTVILDPDSDKVHRTRRRYLQLGLYGPEIVAHHIPPGPLPFTDFFANLVIVKDINHSPYPEEELKRILRPHGGEIRTLRGEVIYRREALEGEGRWTQLYGNPGNTSHSGDTRITSDMTLQWFGGPGPHPMVDRHLRGPAPLYDNGVLIVPGENILIAVDPYNGSELWQRELPSSQRYSMPYDAGYISMCRDRVAIAVNQTCQLMESSSGRLLREFHLPKSPKAHHWGYTLLLEEALLGSIQKDSASRTQPGYEQIDADYRNAQPLVTSQALFRLDPETGQMSWMYRQGDLINSTFTVSGPQVFFVESHSQRARNNPSGRVRLSTLLEGEAYLVSISLESGKPLWKHRLPASLLKCQNILYLMANLESLVACGSFLNEANDTTYQVARFHMETGLLTWETSHARGKAGQTFHGEQLHHPVIMGDMLVAEPFLYGLSDGSSPQVTAHSNRWTLTRPGHSCGTLSAGGSCLFFRATHPTVLNLNGPQGQADAPIPLAPSRTGCWINIIPAGGLVMIPEASAGCVCHFSLQTSMAFLPRNP
ncbi:MAG: PQQ-binding-like beta-propeller repeat protein [Verrucomicrobiota bacterium]|nr:PQQ-binding-like beta-propeller repeat protein [Verrucomicrobiota bacterium]